MDHVREFRSRQIVTAQSQQHYPADGPVYRVRLELVDGELFHHDTVREGAAERHLRAGVEQVIDRSKSITGSEIEDTTLRRALDVGHRPVEVDYWVGGFVLLVSERERNVASAETA